jgi:hypothetical protein
MFEGDSGIFFGPLTGDDVSRMPDALVPDRLAWGTDRYAHLEAYADLRLESAAEARDDPAPDRLAFGRELLMLEPLLDGALRSDGPNPAAMGVVPWDRAVPDVPDAGVAPEKKARRMARRLFPEDDDEDLLPRRPATPDPEALRRAADLVDAIARLGTLERSTEGGVRRARLHALRVDLVRRLGRERRHDAALDGLIGDARALDVRTAARLRGAYAAALGTAPSTEASVDAPAARVRPESAGSNDNPYLAALADAEARLAAPLAQDAPLDLERLVSIQRAAAAAVNRASRGGATAERARERAARLFAEEVVLTGGRPGLRTPAGVDTLALRRALALAAEPVGAPTPSNGGFVPARGLPEVPLLTSRTPGAKVAGSVPAGSAIAVDGPPRAGFYPVTVAGQRRWVPADCLTRADTRPPASWPQPLAAPASLLPLPPARRTGAQTRLDGARGGPIDVRHVLLETPPGGGGEAHRLLTTALSALPDVLTSRMRGRPARAAERDVLELVLDVPAGGTPAVRGRILADQLADALVKAGVSTLDTLNLRLRTREVGTAPATPEGVLESVAADDTASVAAALVAERRTLDAATRSRLAGFFGHDFDDVMVFAGPMSGAMARSLSAEAFTHGKMVFFDPKHFRPDTPRGEALLAHELTHTRQAESRADVKAKEAQALAAEARFLDWVSPGGAPLARELEDAPDVTRRDAQAAADATPGRLGVQRAESGRQLEASEGPRADTARFEERVKTVLERVRLLVGERGDFEADRLGRLLQAGIVRF